MIQLVFLCLQRCKIVFSVFRNKGSCTFSHRNDKRFDFLLNRVCNVLLWFFIHLDRWDFRRLSKQFICGGEYHQHLWWMRKWRTEIKHRLLMIFWIIVNIYSRWPYSFELDCMQPWYLSETLLVPIDKRYIFHRPSYYKKMM